MNSDWPTQQQQGPIGSDLRYFYANNTFSYLFINLYIFKIFKDDNVNVNSLVFGENCGAVFSSFLFQHFFSFQLQFSTGFQPQFAVFHPFPTSFQPVFYFIFFFSFLLEVPFVENWKKTAGQFSLRTKQKVMRFLRFLRFQVWMGFPPPFLQTPNTRQTSKSQESQESHYFFFVFWISISGISGIPLLLVGFLTSDPRKPENLITCCRFFTFQHKSS